MKHTHSTSRGAVACAVAALLLAGCGNTNGQIEVDVAGATATPAATTDGSRDESTPTLPRDRLDPKAKKALSGVGIFETLFNPTFPMPRAWMSRFDAVVLGTVTEFRDGPAYEVFPGDPDAEQRAVLVAEPLAVLAGEAKVGEPMYVRFTVSDVVGLNAALPSGTIAMLAVNYVDQTDDRYFDDPHTGVPDGAPRFDVGPTFAAFADGDAHTWYPMLRETYDEPVTALAPPALDSRLPRSLRLTQ